MDGGRECPAGTRAGCCATDSGAVWAEGTGGAEGAAGGSGAGRLRALRGDWRLRTAERRSCCE